GFEGFEVDVAMELHQRDDAHDNHDRHLEGEEESRQLGGDRDASDHHERREREEDEYPYDPRHGLETLDVVILEERLEEAAHDGDDRSHGRDVARARQDGGGDRGASAEGLADEGDESARGG